MDNLTLTKDEVIKYVIDIIDLETYLRKTEDGIYEGNIDADYRDELDSKTIIKIFKSENPRETLFDLLSENYMDCEWEYKKDVIETVKKHFDDEDEGIFYSDYEDIVRDWIDEHVIFNYPYKHYLDQDIFVDIITDTGDGNYEYTMNELFGCVYSEKGYREESSVTWLMKQQGYSEKQIKKFIEKENFQNSRLLKSIYTECINTTTCMNALTFFVKMTIGECLDLQESLNNSENAAKSLIVSKDNRCGLYDPWNGAGSVLEISLEKDVVLPFQYVDSAYPDGCRGYSVGEIYGITPDYFGNGNIKIA